MFKGTAQSAKAVMVAAGAVSRRLGHDFVGSEHLLLAVAAGRTPTAAVLRNHGLAVDRIEALLDDLGGVPAAVAADCEAARMLGIDVDDLLDNADVRASLRPSPPAHRILPLGWRAAQRRCAAADPPIAGDAQAVFEAALLVALGNWHRWLTDNHLARVLVGLSRGSVLVAERAGLHRVAALADLQAACPPRRRVRRGHIARARAIAA